LVRERDLTGLLQLAWEPPEALLAAAEEAAAGRHRDLLAFLRDLAGRRPDLDPAAPAARRAWEAVREGFLRERDLVGLATAMQATSAGPLAWSLEAREALLERAGRELADDPRALRVLLEVVARGAGADQPSRAWRAALQLLVERHAAAGEHAAVAALMTGGEAGPHRWSAAFRPLHQLATSPALLVIAAAPFLAARFAPDLVPGLFLGLLALLGAAAVWLLVGPPLQREACLPGLLGRITLPLLLVALVGRVWALPPLGGKSLLALVTLAGLGSWLLLAAACSRRAPEGCAVRGALSTLTLGVLQALGLSIALSLVLAPSGLGASGAWSVGPLVLRPGLILAWTALGLFAGAALERGRAR
jgi:hypothetical protein